MAYVGFMPDLKRVFQYHAAEHKAINAYEAGDPLEPEVVQRHSLIHVRCGTAFLLYVMVIAIFVFEVNVIVFLAVLGRSVVFRLGIGHVGGIFGIGRRLSIGLGGGLGGFAITVDDFVPVFGAAA